MNIANWLSSASKTAPDRPALMTGLAIDADYREFARRAGAIAASLINHHAIAPGDRIALYMANSTKYLEALYGVWWAGAVVVPVNARLHPREAAWILQDAGAKLVFSTEDAIKNLDDAHMSHILVAGDEYQAMTAFDALAEPVLRADNDLAWIFYTSGTTGNPKGVMLSHANLVAASVSYLADVDQVEPGDAVLYAAPISHGAGIYNFIHVRMGARHVVPESGGFNPQEIATLAPQLGNVSMFAAPTMVRRLIDYGGNANYGGDGIKTIVYGGGPMYQADILAALEKFGNRFVQIYGQGESPMTITALGRRHHGEQEHSRFAQRLGSVGTAHSVVEVRIGDGMGNAAAVGKNGEIEVRGLTVMLGYWGNPAATDAVLKDGWLMTGDIGRFDEDGFLTLSDRSKDVIITGGSNVYPREVEEVLLQHPDIAEVSVIARPHAEWGEEIVACVTTKPGCQLDEKALDALCLDNIARFKRPKVYVVFSELPKNNYGKILKTNLRALIAKKTPHIEE